MLQPNSKSFADWIHQFFGHAVTDPPWYCDLEADTSEPEPPACVAHMVRLFEGPDVVLASYSDAQVNQGLWYLVGNACYSLIEPEVAWSQRRRGIRAITSLFEHLFARRCSDHLSHLDEVGANPLNSVCYMWWDIFPWFGRPENPAYADLDTELLAVMRRILTLDSLPCWESALHGLGHWQIYYPEVAQQAIAEFLERVGEVRLELREYAERARQGLVL